MMREKSEPLGAAAAQRSDYLPSFMRYWGKASGDGADTKWHLLAYHALDVAAVANTLLAQEPEFLVRFSALTGFAPEGLRRTVPFLLALHDIGKFSEPFQALRLELAVSLQGTRRFASSTFRHDSLGFGLWRRWTQRRPLGEEEGFAAGLLSVRVNGAELGHRDLADVTRPWMAAVIAHHGRPPHEGLDIDVAAAFGSSLEPERGRAATDARAFGTAIRNLMPGAVLEWQGADVDALVHLMKRSSWWLAGFAILCDWLGSNTTFFPYCSAAIPLAEYWTRALEQAERAVAASGVVGAKPRSFRGINALFEIPGAPSPLQEAVCDVALGVSPQLFVLEDLTGSGKTEAALLLAQRLMSSGSASGLYFGLPTMATANAMDKRVRPLLERLFDGLASYVLAHSGHRTEGREVLAESPSGIPERSSSEEPTASYSASGWISDNRKKALLAQLGVGTIDQALLAALQSRHAALRLFGIHRHVLVVDEVHACDAYMLEILSGLLRLQSSLGGSAILLSATLPLAQRRKLSRAFLEGLGRAGEEQLQAQEYPLLTQVSAHGAIERPIPSRSGTARRLPLVFHRKVEDVLARLEETSRQGLCGCWVRNSVMDALEGADLLTERLGSGAVTLFHARFALGDRLTIERDVLRRFGRGGAEADRRGHILVATQVVEQSLDIDFDILVTDLCPVDLVIQRAGRLQRHPRASARPSPVLEVHAPEWCAIPPPGWLGHDFRRTALVYSNPAELWKTAGELERRGALAVPDDTRALIEAVFGGDGDVPETLLPGALRAEGQERAHASVAQNVVLRPEHGYLRTGVDWATEARVPTRLGEPTVTLRLARVDETGVGAWWREGPVAARWPLSQVSIARRNVCAPAPGDASLRAEAEASMPFVDDDVVTLLFRSAEDGDWTAHARAPGRAEGSEIPVLVRYSCTRGLRFERGS